MRVALVLLGAVGRSRSTSRVYCAINLRMIVGVCRVAPRWLTSACAKLHVFGDMACQPGQMHAVVASSPGGPEVLVCFQQSIYWID